MIRDAVTAAAIVAALLAGAAAGWVAHASQPRHGEPAAVNAIRVTAPEAAGRVSADNLGDLAADVNRILQSDPPGDATDAALVARVKRALPVDDRGAYDVVVTLWWTIARDAPAPFGGKVTGR